MQKSLIMQYSKELTTWQELDKQSPIMNITFI